MFAIAGTSGRTGRVVAETLRSQGKQVRAIGRPLEDVATLARALEGAEGCFVLLPEEPMIPDLRAHRRRMADAIAAAIGATRVPHVVFLSSTPAALAEGNGVARELHHAEEAIRDAAPAATIVRACTFQDNVLAALPAARDGIYPSFFPLGLAVPMVATRDVGRFAARCLLELPARSETVDLVGPSYTPDEVAVRLGRWLGRPVSAVPIPPEEHVETLMRFGLPRSFAADVAETFACVVSGRATPRGDRLERAPTELEEVLAAC